MGLWGTIAGIGASLIPGVGPVLGPIVGAAVNGVEQSKAAKDASQAQVSAGNKALDLYSNIYGQQRADLAPYRSAGTSALGAEMSLLGLNPAAMGSLGGGPSGVGVGGAGAGSTANTPWGGTITGASASYLDPNNMGAISDPNKQPDASYGANGQFVGNLSQSQRAQDPATTSSYSTPQMHGSSPMIPILKFQHSDGTVYQIPADQVAEAQKQDPQGKVLGQA
jgi:hypothetical protein